jgi:hypothetical protein
VKPLDCVLVKATGKYQGSAGVVEQVELNEKDKLAAVIVDMDIDHKRVRFAPADLTVIKAH